MHVKMINEQQTL